MNKRKHYDIFLVTAEASQKSDATMVENKLTNATSGATVSYRAFQSEGRNMKKIIGLVVSAGAIGVLALSATPVFAIGGDGSAPAASNSAVYTDTFPLPGCKMSTDFYQVPNQTWKAGEFGSSSPLTVTPVGGAVVRSIEVTTDTRPGSTGPWTGTTIVCLNLPTATAASAVVAPVASTPRPNAWTWPYPVTEGYLIIVALVIAALFIGYFGRREYVEKRKS
jgi:hypothetical protein